MTVLAAALAVGSARAQATGDAGLPEGSCQSDEFPQCPERCPTFDTCIVSEGDGALYYQVEEMRFDCDGLDCREATQRLGDYCCQRGEFAPGSGGCDCRLSPPAGAPDAEPLALAGLGLAVACRALRRAQRSRRASSRTCGSSTPRASRASSSSST
jgi:hypothetical protein